MPKRSTAVVCALLLLIALAHAPVCAEAQEDYDPQFTMLTLNMAIVSVFNIVSTQDRIVLDQEYENIINNLKLGNIEDDYEIKALYEELMLIISNTRLREEEKVRFLEKFDRREKEALVGALSGIRAYGGNAWSFLGSLLTSGVSAYFGYRDSINQMQHELGDEMWQLRKEQIEDFDDLQRRLLNSSWTLLRKYRLPDEYRITQRDLVDLGKAVQEEDKSRAVRMFKALETNFKAYPTFWYFYGRAAMMNSDEKLAEKCFEEFERVWRPVLRQDPYKLEVAKNRAESLVKRQAPIEEIMKQLVIISEHAPRANWNAKLFLGVISFALGEKKAGIEFVEENVFFDIEKDLSVPILRSMEQDRLDTSQLGRELQSALRERAAKESDQMKEEEKDLETASIEPEQIQIEKGLIAYFENRDEDVEKIFAPLVQVPRNPVPVNVLGILKADARSKIKNIPESLSLFSKRNDLKEKNESAFNAAYVQFLPVVEKFAKDGNARAQALLGILYDSGRGVPQDDRQAAEWYRKAAEQGDPTAQYNFAQMYKEGRGVPQDDHKAVEWSRKAADQGDSTAQGFLGWLYAEGQGVPQDDRRAVEWYKKAADQGEPVAQRLLGWMYSEGRGVPQDDRRAVEWVRKAAEQGETIAQRFLGELYGEGRGVPQNYSEAYFWFYLALLNGDDDAQTGLDKIEGKGLFNLRKLSDEEIERARHKATQMFDEQRRK